jgi:hypothetical protein
MKESVKLLAAPLWGLTALLVIATSFCVLITMQGGEISNASATFYNMAFGYLAAWGVELDRKALGISAPFEYSAFMFFFWLILLPFYLFQTRRWRGLVVAVAILFISSLPNIVALGVYVFVGDAL